MKIRRGGGGGHSYKVRYGSRSTGRPKPRQDKRLRARRQNRVGIVKFQAA